MSLYDRIFKPRIYTLPNGTGVEGKRSRAAGHCDRGFAGDSFHPHYGL